MKRFSTLLIIPITVLLFCLQASDANAQAVSINSTGNAPNGFSIIDVSSTAKGALLPRMTTAQRTTLGGSLGATEEGMTVYDTQFDAYFYWDGTQWREIPNTDNVSVSLDEAYDDGGSGAGRIITADAGAVEIQDADGLIVAGNVGIGSTTNTNFKLLVSGGTAGFETILMNLHSASSNVNTETTLKFTNAATSTTNSGSGEIAVARTNRDATGDAAMYFRTSNGSGAPANRMTILDNGFVGIGTTAPDFELDVAGNIGVDQYITHNGNVDTEIEFPAAGDQITLWAGGVRLFDVIQDDTNPESVVVNETGTDVDFRVESDLLPNLLFADASENNIGINTNSPDPESILDIQSTNSGVLLPRMTNTQRNNINPTAASDLGLVIYNTSTSTYDYWDGTAWQSLLTSAALALTMDDTYDGGTPNSGSGRAIIVDQGPVQFNGTGGTIAIETDGDIQLTEDDAWIGSSPSLQRIRFDDNSGGRIHIEDADMTIDDGRWIGIDASNPRFVFDNTNDEVELMDSEFGIGTADPENLLHVYEAIATNGELVLGKFEAFGTSGNGATAGITVVGERPASSADVAFLQFENNDGTPNTPLVRITSNKIGNGQLMVNLGDGAGGLVERMVLDNGGNLQLDGLIEATSSVVTSTAAGVLQSLPIGSNDDVLKISGGAITWGPATVSSLSVSLLTGGTAGDILYNNGGTWTALNEPGTVGSYALTTAGSGAAPAWQATSAFGDDLGNHTATENIKLETFAIEASDGIVNIDDNLAINGKVVSDGINETSDVRFKKNIEHIGDALGMVLNLEGVTYNWRTDEFPEKKFSTGREYGVIAQQIEKYIPEVVNTDATTGYKSVQYSHLVPLLIEAIKEQNELLSKQDSEISKLKASVESLSDFISTSKK